MDKKKLSLIEQVIRQLKRTTSVKYKTKKERMAFLWGIEFSIQILKKRFNIK